MSPTQWIIIISGTLLILLFSWFVSLREKRYHAIPRFFVFEGLLVFGLMQADVWFKDPLIPRQIASWILFIASIYYAFYGILIYFLRGKPGENFENSTRLVTSGLYKYIRHPMYASLLFLGWGMFLKEISLVSVIIVTFITIAVFITCKVEEQEMLKKFGVEYKEYMTKTKLWIPYLI